MGKAPVFVSFQQTDHASFPFLIFFLRGAERKSNNVSVRLAYLMTV